MAPFLVAAVAAGLFILALAIRCLTQAAVDLHSLPEASERHRAAGLIQTARIFRRQDLRNSLTGLTSGTRCLPSTAAAVRAQARQAAQVAAGLALSTHLPLAALEGCLVVVAAAHRKPAAMEAPEERAGFVLEAVVAGQAASMVCSITAELVVTGWSFCCGDGERNEKSMD